MATYDELSDIASGISGVPLKGRILVAITIKAQAMVDGTPTATQLAWAQEALMNPLSKRNEVLHYMIANNNSALASVITNASDALIQTNTDAAIAALVP